MSGNLRRSAETGEQDTSQTVLVYLTQRKKQERLKTRIACNSLVNTKQNFHHLVGSLLYFFTNFAFSSSLLCHTFVLTWCQIKPPLPVLDLDVLCRYCHRSPSGSCSSGSPHFVVIGNNPWAKAHEKIWKGWQQFYNHENSSVLFKTCWHSQGKSKDWHLKSSGASPEAYTWWAECRQAKELCRNSNRQYR